MFTLCCDRVCSYRKKRRGRKGTPDDDDYYVEEAQERPISTMSMPVQKAGNLEKQPALKRSQTTPNMIPARPPTRSPERR